VEDVKVEMTFSMTYAASATSNKLHTPVFGTNFFKKRFAGYLRKYGISIQKKRKLRKFFKNMGRFCSITHVTGHLHLKLVKIVALAALTATGNSTVLWVISVKWLWQQ
jgi:hypothetical protein